MSTVLSSTITLTDEQERAMAAIDAFMTDPGRQVFNLHGLAGTGKTTVLRHIAAQYKHAVLCSLTDKAASVLRRFGLPASALHSFFYRLIAANKDKRGRDVLHFERQHGDGHLTNDLVLLDESSMIGDEIGRDLLATGAKVIACGNSGQLPPISGERFFNRADFTLQETHRQALESPIIRLVCLKNAAAYGVFKGGVYTLLEAFRQGDTSIALDVDGEMVTVPQVTFRGVTSSLRPDAEVTTSFDFGYAMTVHKAQGSEWDSIILYDEYRRADQRREWLYTGVTRAAQRILVVR